MSKHISKFPHFSEISDREYKEYFRMALSLDCVVLGFEEDELKILLAKSHIREHKNVWMLPGDLLKPDEDLDAAPARILRERISVDHLYIEQIRVFPRYQRHIFGRVISVGYCALVNIKEVMIKTESELYWQKLHEVTDLAFDHKIIVETCLKQLRERLMEQPLALHLLPVKFSLRTLQVLYEAILGEELDRRNFRKKIFAMDWLVDVDELEEDVAHRPGKLYKGR